MSKVRNVIKKHHATVLSDRDRDLFLKMLDANTKPNQALKKAFKAHQSSVEGR